MRIQLLPFYVKTGREGIPNFFSDLLLEREGKGLKSHFLGDLYMIREGQEGGVFPIFSPACGTQRLALVFSFFFYFCPRAKLPIKMVLARVCRCRHMSEH